MLRKNVFLTSNETDRQTEVVNVTAKITQKLYVLRFPKQSSFVDSQENRHL